MKMPTIVAGIFIFICREIFMLSCVEHEQSFITSAQGLSDQILRVHTVYTSFSATALQGCWGLGQLL